MEDGLYDSVISETLSRKIDGLNYQISAIPSQQLAEYLAEHVKEFVLTELLDLESQEAQMDYVNNIFSKENAQGFRVVRKEILKSLLNRVDSDKTKIAISPEIPLSELALMTNAKGDPAIGSELPKELLSADSVDILMAFVRQSGLNVIYESLKALRNRNVKVRLITSTYMGATEKKSIDQLVRDLGVEVRIDYKALSNRLHAKAWLMNRKSGFSTAYVGSSNISNPALITGVEWNVRLSAVRSPEVLSKIAATFESYWNSPDFLPYNPEEDGASLEEALSRAKGQVQEGASLVIGNLDVTPLPHQSQMLTELAVERDYHGHHRNLVVAATGSGKTVLSAFDFKTFFESNKGATLLFVAHRKEILNQSRITFAQVLKDPSFGEMYVDGQKPSAWNHVFASIQSLSEKTLAEIEPGKFDFIIIDEFHHAAASSYEKVIKHFKPKELLGLTATPERTNGQRVQDLYFDGRIATELRLWDALDQELLSPFHYFGISEETDFQGIDWKGSAGYDSTQLSGLVTGNSIRDKLVFDELERKVSDFDELKALIFCVDISHANYISDLFTKKGLPVVSVTSETSSDARAKAISDLKSGAIKGITSVDIFNEGVDIPSVNTVVMLRPTESPLIFLQQLGRGLRKSPGKSGVLVLDFIGAHRAEYRLDLKLCVLTGRSRGDLQKDVEQNFPFLPSGVVVSLDRLSKERVLASVRNQVAPGQRVLALEVKAIGETKLSGYLDKSAREPWEIYRHNGLSWTQLLQSSTLTTNIELSSNLPLISKFLHVNDPVRFEAYTRFMSEELKPWASVSEEEKRLRNMFFWHVWPDAKDPNGDRWKSVDFAISSLAKDSQFSEEFLQVLHYLDDKNRNFAQRFDFKNADIPLLAHANYSRYEILGATGKAYLEGFDFGKEISYKSPKSIAATLEGVTYIQDIELDVFFITLKKSEGFSATTRYVDYAESQDVFHWESQNKTSVDSPTGNRYVSQGSTKSDVLLCIRESADSAVKAQTFRVAGLADYLRHEGDRPIKIWWKLRIALDLQSFKEAAAIRVA